MAAKAWVIVWYTSDGIKQSTTVSARMLQDKLDELHSNGSMKINANPIRG